MYKHKLYAGIKLQCIKHIRNYKLHLVQATLITRYLHYYGESIKVEEMLLGRLLRLVKVHDTSLCNEFESSADLQRTAKEDEAVREFWRGIASLANKVGKPGSMQKCCSWMYASANGCKLRIPNKLVQVRYHDELENWDKQRDHVENWILNSGSACTESAP